MQDKRTSPRAALHRIFLMLGPQRIPIALSFLLATASVLMTLWIPILTGRAIDQIVGAGAVRFDLLRGIILQIVIALAAGAASQWLMTQINNRITYSLVRTLRNEAFDKIHRIPLSWLDTHPAGDLASRIVTDIEQISDGLLLAASQLFTGILTIIGTICFMLTIHVRIALLVIVLSPMALLIAQYISRRTFRYFRAQSEARGDLTAYTNEILEEMKLVQAFAQQDTARDQFDRLNDTLAVHTRKATFFSSLTNPTTRLAYALIYAGVAIAGCFLCITSGGAALSVGMLSTFLGYTSQYTRPFSEISGILTEFQSAIVSAQRVFALIDETEEAPDPVTAEDHVQTEEPNGSDRSVRGHVVLDSVSFSYAADRPLIRDLNLDVPPGARIAIVGPTGSGKTTLINLLMRFYDVDAGSIRVDGTDLRAMRRRDLRSQYAMVLQDVWLKHASVRDNIAYGDPDADEAAILRAAKAVHAHEFIVRLPDGYDTVIGEDGGMLSLGQQQLLCVARAMLHLPPMLILDEATSSIDTLTEHRIRQAFDEMMQGRTTFVVAHRLSTIRDADQILVMDQGRIVEQGTHAELLARSGFYARLYDLSKQSD